MSSNFTPQQLQKIIDKLNELHAVRECPRCGNKNFTVMDGYFVQTVQPQANNITLGGSALPSIVVICSKCGFLSQHALGTLGFVTDTGELKVE